MKLPITSARRLPRLPVVLLLTALAAPWAQAQTAPAGARHGGMAQLDTTLQSIGASADQRSRIEAIMTQARADLRAQRQAQGALHLQLAQALAAPTVDPTVAEGVRQKLLAQHDASSQRMLQAKLAEAAVLSADQRQKLYALMQQQKAAWKAGHGQRPAAAATTNG